MNNKITHYTLHIT